MYVPLRLICLGFLAALATGCESTNWNWLKRDTGRDVAGKGGASPDVKGLVDYLNANAQRVNTLRVEDVAIDITQDNQTFGVRGRVYAEKPRNFRMRVTSGGKDEVDVGSNQQEFWFWAARNPDRYQYFCAYKDLSEGKMKVMMPLPIQPEWVMEALGLGPYGPAEKYQLEPATRPNEPTLRLVEKSKSPQGHAVRKVIVMNRKEVRAPTPQVTAFLLLDDATGKEICSAHITSTVVDRGTGAILPYKIEIRMPKEKVSMLLRLEGAKVNEPIVATAFQRQAISGAEPFNLATGRIEPSLQGAGGFR